MGAPKKQAARAAFDLNMEDAEILVNLAEMLTNRRARKMRREMRQRIGDALRIPQKARDHLECLESDIAFVAFKPGNAEWRERLDEPNLRPLLRQAIVAGCAAVETYCADRVIERLPAVLKRDPPPSRLLEMSMTVQDYLRIEQDYVRKTWGLRQLIELEVREKASTAPSQIGALFALVGESKVLARVDAQRKVGKNSTHTTLERVTKRRNRIAHQGDRVNRSRAMITVEEVRTDLAALRSIVHTLDDITCQTATPAKK
jgi:hypothetical protein